MIPDHGRQATAGQLVDRARAKVNLTLRILGRRPDGYHELESLVAFADEGDVLTLDLGRPAGLAITGPLAKELIGGAENLVSKAVARVAAAAPGLVHGQVTLEKHLPVAAGIGGGSADAGAILRLLRRCNPSLSWSQTVDTDDDGDAPWLAIAAVLGADVPVCFTDRAALMTGIGEHLALLDRPLDLPAVLVNPMTSVPANKTAAVFKALAAGPLDAAVSRVRGAPADLDRYIAEGTNDLERPATEVMPVIGAVLAAMRSMPGCRLARLSGAGPTCFGLFDTADAADGARSALSARHGDWWIRATRLR